MFAATKWQFFVFKHKMAAVTLSLHKTWMPWHDAENEQEKDVRDGKQTRGSKGRKRRLPCFVHFFNFTCSGKTEKYGWCSENVTVFVIIFPEKTLTAGKNYTCVKAPNYFFFLFAPWKNALLNDKTNKAREVNKRGRTRYPLRWAVQNGQSFGFLKQLKRLRNGQKLEKEMVCSQQVWAR